MVHGHYHLTQTKGLTEISTIVNFGALTAFSLLNIAVVWWFIVRQKSRRWFVHLVIPLLGLAILIAVIINANIAAQILGVLWLAVGVIVAIILLKTGRMTDPSGSTSPIDAKEVR